MVWGCFGWNGVGKLVEVQGIMDKHQCCEILEDGVLESFEVLDLEEGERYFSKIMIPNMHPIWALNGL